MNKYEQKTSVFAKGWRKLTDKLPIILISLLVGLYLGFSTATEYCAQRLDEIVETGAMLHKSKVYTVLPKL